MEENGLNVYQVAQFRAALDQAGQDGSGRISGGLGVGSLGPAPGVGELALAGCIRGSTALGAWVTFGADQSIPAATWTAVQWTAARCDTDGLWDEANPCRLTIRTGGVYVFHAFVVWDTARLGQVALSLWINGTEVVTVTDTIASTLPNTGDLPGVFQHLAAVVWADEGDTLEAVVFQNTPGALNLKYNASRPAGAGMARVA